MAKLLEIDPLEVLFQRTVVILEWYGWANNPNTFHPLQDGPRNLLMALQQVCGSTKDYIECIECLAGLLEVGQDENSALGIVRWENCKTRTITDVKDLLLGRYVC